MPKRLGSARAIMLALFTLVLAVAAGVGQAADGPSAGRYEIRTYYAASDDPSRAYGVVSYMILRADGSYELYDSKSNELRSRGTYAFEPGNAGAAGSVGRVRWKSGINYDMGRGGSYFLSSTQFKCQNCIQMGSYVIAVPSR